MPSFTVTSDTTGVQVSDGNCYRALVKNTGSVDVIVSPGNIKIEPGATGSFYPKGSPLVVVLPRAVTTAGAVLVTEDRTSRTPLRRTDLVRTGPRMAASIPPSGTFYIAHRGGGDYAPEHTLQSYSMASVLPGISAVEVSAHITKDRVPICMHDTTLDRTTNATGNIADRTYRDLQHNVAITYGSTFIGPAWPNQPIPALVDVLDRIADKCTIFFEPKAAGSTSVDAMLDLLAQYPHADIVWKFFRASNGVLPTHAARAKAAGYRLWIYHNADDDATLLSASASQADFIGMPITSTDQQISLAVAAANAYNRPVIVWEVHRRSDVTRLSNLGVRGMMCSGPEYVMRNYAITNRVDGAAGLRLPGMVPNEIGGNTYHFPTFDAANRAIILGGSSRTVLLGTLAPLANPSNYTIDFAMRWPTIPGSTNHADFIFGHATDSPYAFQSTGNDDGYHIVFRGNGQLQIYSHTTASSSGTQLATVNTTTPVANAWMTFRITVTPTTVAVQRLDDASSAISAASTLARGSYMHLNTASVESANLTHYRDIIVG